jgi:dihydroxyacid dehydratase/phosphogluconate dehydratase
MSSAAAIPPVIIWTRWQRGNIAPEGAVVKFSAVGPDMLTHEGSAKVFDSEEAVIE